MRVSDRVVGLKPLMPIARLPADDEGKTDDHVEPRLTACEDAAGDELVWKAPDAELDQVLVPVDGEN